MYTENMTRFRDDIYTELSQGGRGVYSLYYLCKNYRADFGEEISYDHIRQSFLEDDRFIFINDTQLMLRDLLLDIVINQMPDADILSVARHIQNTYYANTVEHHTIAQVIKEERSGEDCSQRCANESYIKVSYGDNHYDIMHPEDIIHVAVEEGNVTPDVLKGIADYFDENADMLLSDILGVNATMAEDPNTSFSIVYKTKEDLHGEASPHNGSNRDMRDDENDMRADLVGDRGANILMLDLKPNELIASLAYLYTLANKNSRELKEGSAFLGGNNLNILSELEIVCMVENELILTKNGRALIESMGEHIIGEYIVGKYDKGYLSEIDNIYSNVSEFACSGFVSNLDNDSRVWRTLKISLNKKYLNDQQSSVLFELLRKYGQDDCHTLGDIIIQSTYEYELSEILNILVDGNATGSTRPILENRDICFNCRHSRCIKDRDTDLSSLLIKYRKQYVNQFMERAKKDNKVWQQVRDDPLIIKFIASYLLCNRMKEFFIKLELIEKSDVLLKDDGQYCPFKDRWVVNI